MPQLLNQYSYVFASLGVLLALALVMLWLRARPRLVVGALLGMGTVLVVGWFVFRPGASDVNSLEAAEAAINNGRPTLVEFFSNYCAGCIAVRASFDRLASEIESRFGDQVNILRVDIHTGFGRALRERYGFEYTPEFVLFDAGGNEVWRSHVPPALEQIEALAVGVVSKAE